MRGPPGKRPEPKRRPVIEKAVQKGVEAAVQNVKWNHLSLAQEERLYLLLEELGEAQQVIGKILRFGYDSQHPAEFPNGPTNKQSLEQELGDIDYVVGLLCSTGDISNGAIMDWNEKKRQTIAQYLHHQDEQKL